MSTRRRRAALICSTLLGALVISCGGPPADVAAPAPIPPQAAVPEPRGAPAQERGLREVVPRAPAPEAAPLPAPAPAGQPPPAVEQKAPESPPAQRRPPGVPVGIRSPDIPEDGNDWYEAGRNDWNEAIEEACEPDYEPQCLGVDYKFLDQNGNRISEPPDGESPEGEPYGGLYSSCTIQRTPDPDEYISLGDKILVVTTCKRNESPPPSTPAEFGQPNQQPGNNENAEDDTAERGGMNTPRQQSDVEQDETRTEDGSGE